MSDRSSSADAAADTGGVRPATDTAGLCPAARPADIGLAEFQQLIRRMYYEKDLARGPEGTFMWLMEEVGELAASIRGSSQANRVEEFADVLAWLATIANVVGVDLADAVRQKYGGGCPGCGHFICTCADAEKP